jgi:hypothetical protein
MRRRDWRLVKKRLIQAASGLLFLLGIVYVSDYLWLRIRIGRQQNALGAVEIQPYYAIAEKNNKTQFISADPLTVPCVHALFPHFGYSPCWYVTRHTDQRIDE